MEKIFTLIAFFIIGSLTAQDLELGLVMHYNFEDNLTETISGETAENFGSLTFGEGKIGNGAVRFFNQDAYFVTPYGKLQVGPTVDGGTAGTYTMWVNHRAEPLDTDRQNYIAQKNGCGPEDNNRGRVVLYRQNPNNATDPDSLISFIGGAPLRTNYKLDMADTWIHLTLTIEPDIREWAFFVDGLETRRDTFAGTRNAENSCGEYVIGHHLTFTNETQTFDGLMDDLRFYNRVLTQEEITLLASGTVSTKNDKFVDAVKLSPNPAATYEAINLEIDNSIFTAGSQINVKILDITGRQMLERNIENVSDEVILNHNLNPGLFTVVITDGNKIGTIKLIVQ